jgi:hypothetical protein
MTHFQVDAIEREHAKVELAKGGNATLQTVR